ncbi:phage Gp19/Gp15/Gp42 family protein [Pseudarthrobacter sp. HLT3-5]|uniref:Gp19/Gp15/Gp42 family protein n=1 Tax=Pseudarthrobacter cellobiosi TaxID=2953654 RepID=UPI00208E54A0|nr:Gp19/Gp15/Gp42 family protein [Pseudarthrobacter sp. HLT3-5]MCO4276126.1 phage Gp19/Gp15/Gp42 family protein [Pseudarthrobacter sp. HLT3-5]
MVDLAQPEAVVAAWRPLTSVELARVTYYLGSASRKIRRRWRDVDARIAANTLAAEDVSDVVVQMVLSAVDVVPIRGAKSFSEGVGPMSRSATLTGASTDPLVIEDWMVEVFEGSSTTKPVASFPTSGNYESQFIWPEGRS